MRVLENIAELAACRPEGGQGDVHAIADAALAWDGEDIAWVGPRAALPDEFRGAERLDAGGGLVIPGLVDCHTHLAFARAGGGMARTVRLTRAAGEEALLARARRFRDEMLALGVTTVECKSGYGLDREHELELLRVYRRLAEEGPTRVVATFLGAHVVPPEYRDRRDAYLRLLIEELIPEVADAGLASACDVFVEEAAFGVAEARRILLAARAAGLALRLHADQLGSSGGAELAAEVGARSADHLEHVSEAGIAAMARAGVVAVSLPIATLYLAQPPLPARRLIAAGVPVAVATDFNPGSAPSYHLPLALTLACTLQRMTPAEALKGATCIAARVLGLERRIGSLTAGRAADFVVVDAPDVATWLYHLRPSATRLVVVRGRVCWPGGEADPAGR